MFVVRRRVHVEQLGTRVEDSSDGFNIPFADALNQQLGDGEVTEADLHDQMVALADTSLAVELTGSGAAFCSGRGEIVEPISIDTPDSYLLACPRISISTADIYKIIGNI